MNTYYLRPLTAAEALEKWCTLVEKLYSARKIEAQFQTNIDGMHHAYSGAPKGIRDTPEVQKLLQTVANPALSATCQSFRVADVGAHPHPTIQYTPDESGLFSRIVLSGIPTPERAIEIITSLGQYFSFIPRRTFTLEGLPQIHQDGLRAHDTAVADLRLEVAKIATFNLRQTEQQTSFLQKATVDLTERSRQLDAELEARRREFDDDLRKRVADIDDQSRKRALEIEEQYRRQAAELEEKSRQQQSELEEKTRRASANLQEREEAHRLKVSDWDVRQNMAARRELLKDIRRVIDEQKTFALSSSTEAKRRYVHALCLVALAVALGLVGFFGYKLWSTDAPHWFNVAPVSAGLLFLVSTLVYYVKWNDQWFREHAQAEMRNKKLNADILRASWLAELFLEGKDKERQLPDMLVSRFSEGLFLDVSSPSPDHPADQMVDLLKRVSSVEVGKDGVKVAKTATKD